MGCVPEDGETPTGDGSTVDALVAVGDDSSVPGPTTVLVCTVLTITLMMAIGLAS